MSKTVHELDRSYFELMADLSECDKEQQDEVDRAYNKVRLEATGE